MLRTIIVIALAGMAVATSDAAAQEPFYKGKRLTMLINFAPGGGVDVSGRLFARHLARHIEGQPNVIVQNMDGAAGINGANYVGEVAAKDGTVMGYLGALPWQYVTSPERFRVDLRTYDFVAYELITTVFFMRRDLAPGMKDATDIVKAKGLISGGLGATHARDLNIRLMLDLLEVPYRHVTGYSSSEKARLAMQRNEINFTGETTPGYRLAVESLVARGEFIPVFFSPDWKGQTLSVAKQVADLPILPFTSSIERSMADCRRDRFGTRISRRSHCTRQCRVFSFFRRAHHRRPVWHCRRPCSA